MAACGIMGAVRNGANSWRLAAERGEPDLKYQCTSIDVVRTACGILFA
jgi:hypothetical protein